MNAFMGYCLCEVQSPADMSENQLMGFMLYMVECRGTLPHTARQYVGDIAQILIKQGMQDPYIECMKSLKALEGRLKVLYPHTVKKRLPLVQQDLMAMWSVMTTTTTVGARFKAMVLVMWQTVSRFDDIVNIKRSDLVEHDDHFVLLIGKHKMSYITGQRFTQKMVAKPLFPGATESQLLSAAVALTDYLRLDPTLPIQKPAKEYLFRGLDRKQMSYAPMLVQFRRVLAAAGYNPLNYGLHSPRIGGATCALGSSGGNEFITKQMGFWASNSVRLYCRPTHSLIVDIQRAMVATTATTLFNM